MIFVTGGAGFIGTNFVQSWMAETNETIINIDMLTYAGNANLQSTLFGQADVPENYIFEKIDIGDSAAIGNLFGKYTPRAVVHFAAESHVDRSIDSPRIFIETNILGTYSLLEQTRKFLARDKARRENFRFLHVSTDEVYGSLGPDADPFSEDHPYRPNSAYSASKAASDHLVRAWHKTYDVPTLTTNCSNNYGPHQFPEKLIPLIINNAVKGHKLPIYGNGKQIRDWLHVHDHCAALRTVLEHGVVGEVYNVGGDTEISNIKLVQMICDYLDQLKPRADGQSYRNQIEFVEDRPGHDRRYAINSTKIKSELGWIPAIPISTGIENTVKWYLEKPAVDDRLGIVALSESGTSVRLGLL